MTTHKLELPALPTIFNDDNTELREYAEISYARERILMARIAELEADAERLDFGRITFTTRDAYGEPTRVTFTHVDLRAAIDAARGAK